MRLAHPMACDASASSHLGRAVAPGYAIRFSWDNRTVIAFPRRRSLDEGQDGDAPARERSASASARLGIPRQPSPRCALRAATAEARRAAASGPCCSARASEGAVEDVAASCRVAHHDRQRRHRMDLAAEPPQAAELAQGDADRGGARCLDPSQSSLRICLACRDPKAVAKENRVVHQLGQAAKAGRVTVLGVQHAGNARRHGPEQRGGRGARWSAMSFGTGSRHVSGTRTVSA